MRITFAVGRTNRKATELFVMHGERGSGSADGRRDRGGRPPPAPAKGASTRADAAPGAGAPTPRPLPARAPFPGPWTLEALTRGPWLAAYPRPRGRR